MGQADEEEEHGEEEQPAADHGGDEDGQRGDGGDFEAAEDIGVALLHAAHTGAPESIAEDAHDEHGADEIGDASSDAGMKQFGEGEEEDEREEVIEKQHAAIAQREPHIAFEQRQVSLHSRRLFPVSSMNVSSRDGLLMRISASSTPCSSSHFTRSTTMRAGRAVVTEIRVRPWWMVALFASGQLGRVSSPRGAAVSISMVELARVLS